MTVTTLETTALQELPDVICSTCHRHPTTAAILDNMGLGARDDDCPRCGGRLIFPPLPAVA